jgi:hypothetical protein
MAVVLSALGFAVAVAALNLALALASSPWRYGFFRVRDKSKPVRIEMTDVEAQAVLRVLRDFQRRAAQS